MSTRQMLSKHKYTDNVTDIVFFIVYYIFFGFIETLVLKSIPSIFIFLDKRIELSRSFIEASSEIVRKIKYFLAKQSNHYTKDVCG